jgi:hypothetical protein
MANEMCDVIALYRRLEKSHKRGVGTRLTRDEVAAIMCDGAVRQAMETADYEESSDHKLNAG